MNERIRNKVMPIRHAACSCGQLRVACGGDPVRVSMCHCLECQRRTGSVFGAQARYTRAQVRSEGKATVYSRKGDEGGTVTFNFCPVCGSTVYWQIDRDPDLVAVAVGAFADPGFQPPQRSVYERRRHGWVVVPESPGMEHLD
jgi:hypothetical protein